MRILLPVILLFGQAAAQIFSSCEQHVPTQVHLFALAFDALFDLYPDFDPGINKVQNPASAGSGKSARIHAASKSPP